MEKITEQEAAGDVWIDKNGVVDMFCIHCCKPEKSLYILPHSSCSLCRFYCSGTFSMLPVHGLGCG